MLILLVSCLYRSYAQRKSLSLIRCDSKERSFGLNNNITITHRDLRFKTNVFEQAHSVTGDCSFDEARAKTRSLVAEDKIGVLLLNLGGPETLNDVQPFLYNLFADPVRIFDFVFCDLC